MPGSNFNKVYIANMALVRLGQNNFVNSLEGVLPKPEEKIINQVIDNVINRCLLNINPNFAFRTLTTMPNEQGEIALPSDCLRVVSVNGNESTGAYRIIKDVIIPIGFSPTKDQQTEIVYISNDMDYLQNATPQFVKFCSLVLASELCQAIAKDLQLKSIIDREVDMERMSLLHNENIDNPTLII
jgi:hypothetical protein